MSPRAAALAPAERRARLVETARDLITDRGAVPTTREIAEAAGVAEGTIFRVFETKDDLVDAVVALAFCPAPFRGSLRAVDPALPLRERLVALVTLLQRRFVDVFGLMSALGLGAPPAFPPGAHDDCTPELGHVGAVPHAGGEPAGRRTAGRPADDAPEEAEGPPVREMLRHLEPDAHRLRCPPGRLLQYVRLLTFAGSHHELADGVLLTPEEIVDVLLDGVLLPADRSAGDHPPGDPTGDPTGDAPCVSSPPTRSSRKAS